MTGRGRVRFELLMRQVRAALPPPPARVVDAGGGTGQLAVPLAGLGYQVTVVDTSAAMLATCAQRAAAEGRGASARLATVQGDAADVAGLLGGASQDAVICHDVLAGVDDPAELLGALAGVLREGGTLSLAFPNRDWLALRAGRRGDYAGALRLLDDPLEAAEVSAAWRGARSESPGPGARRAYTAAELRPWLDKAGFELAGVLGVGVFAEGRDEELDRAASAALLQLEQQVADREPYRSGAQTVHIVGRRRVLRHALAGYTT
ncbi:MAG TPA: methyltransferase domain-containing protein [Actinomycetota bacterium]|nr:methyltransferase domain-containing protein [Actinomycetota bacterium]